MNRFFNFSVIAIALVAVTMTSCKKDEPLKELDINLDEIVLKDNTENTFTIKVTDYRTGNAIAGAAVKDSKGNTVATTAEDGTATYTKKAGDELLFTIEADGYAAMTAGSSVSLFKLDAKLSGIATYTDKMGNLNAVPAGTVLSVQTYSDGFVQRIYRASVGSDGKFEFAALPNGANLYFVSPTTIGGNSYNVSTYYTEFTAGTTATMTVNYSYINNETPFAIIASPGTITATGNIVIKFNKAVDTGYGSNYVEVYSYDYGYVSYSTEWSSDKKTLTLKPTTTWGDAGGTINVWFRFYTPATDGVRESASRDYYVQIVD